MPDQPHTDRQEQIKPLSLESAIVDVAPKVIQNAVKPSPPQQQPSRSAASGRITLRPSD